MMDKTEELETWDQILSLDDISKGNSDPSKVPTRDTTPGQWDCSSYLSRSKSGYFGGTNNSARKSVSSSLSTEKTGVVSFDDYAW